MQVTSAYLCMRCPNWRVGMARVLTKIITLRVTEHEARVLTDRAADHGVGLSEYIRKLLITDLNTGESTNTHGAEINSINEKLNEIGNLNYMAISTVCALAAGLIAKKDGESEDSINNKRRDYLDRLLITAEGYFSNLKKREGISELLKD